MRQATANKNVKPWNTEVEGATELEAISRQLVKTQQTEKI
jgi:hypothetical protein